MKEILLHEIPVIALALGAIFGLNAEEQNTIAQVLTDIVVGIFAVIPIVKHRILKKKTAISEVQQTKDGVTTKISN